MDRDEKGRYVKGCNNGLLGKKLTEQHKLNISNALKGHPVSEETKQKRRGKNNHFFGKHHTEETKRKIGEANKGKKSFWFGKTGENAFWWGKKHTEETKRKLSLYWKGEKNPKWNGGRRKSCGYIFILMPEHPNANYMGYIQEHRFIMEQAIGRYLYPYETVHHINGIKDDNRIENLELLPDKGKHNTQVQKVYQENLRLKKELEELKLQLVN